jgi:hypothetical protein
VTIDEMTRTISFFGVRGEDEIVDRREFTVVLRIPLPVRGFRRG